MKVFITGATGNVGTQLVNQLLLRGWSVDAFVLPNEDADSLISKGVTVFRGDVTDGASIDQAVKTSSPDVILHLAASVQLGIPSNKKIKARMYDVNVNGTRNVLTSALQNNITQVVYFSSIAIFGISKKGEIITEDTPLRWENIISEYGKSKYLAYQEAVNIQKQGLSLLIFMPGIAFGPNTSGVASIVRSFDKGNRRYLPDNDDESNLPWVFNQDIPQAVIAGIEQNRFGEKYILVESTPTHREFLNLFVEITGREIELKTISYKKAYLLAWLAETISKIKGREPKITKERIKILFKYWQQFDTSKAKRELGWQPTPLKSALTKTILARMMTARGGFAF